MQPRLLALTFLAACSFAADVPGEGGDGTDAGITPAPNTRCQDPDLALCIDFEDPTAPRDGVVPEATLTYANLASLERLTDERSAGMGVSPISQLHIADTTKLDLAQAMTVEMWTKPTAVPPATGDEQVGLFDVSQQYQLNYEADGDIECVINGGAPGFENVDSKDDVPIDAWHHVACTFDGATLKVYVDGKLQGCRPTGMVRTISRAAVFGAAVGANMAASIYRNPFVGELDNVHVYARALSAADICAIWGNGNCDDKCPATKPAGPGGGGGFGDD